MNYTDLSKNHSGYHNFSSLKETEKAYWAGLLDGEGCLRVEKSNTNQYPFIALKMTCERTVQDFANTFGLNVSKRSRACMKEHWKDCYSAKMTTHKASKVCEALLPYFITKREIAEELSKFYIEKCEECPNIFWSFNCQHTCSKECQHKRKLKLDTLYRAEQINRYEQKKKSLV